MLSPFDPNKDTGSYVNLQKRVFQRIQSSEIHNHIIETIRRSYEDAINAENIELDPVEKKRHLSQVVRLVLEDLNKKVDDGLI
jgi:hypothetical protein